MQYLPARVKYHGDVVRSFFSEASIVASITASSVVFVAEFSEVSAGAISGEIVGVLVCMVSNVSGDGDSDVCASLCLFVFLLPLLA